MWYFYRCSGGLKSWATGGGGEGGGSGGAVGSPYFQIKLSMFHFTKPTEEINLYKFDAEVCMITSCLTFEPDWSSCLLYTIEAIVFNNIFWFYIECFVPGCLLKR